MNVKEDLNHYRGAPWTILDTSHPHLRSVRLDCCLAPFCEVPNPAACTIENICRDPDRFEQLQEAGHVPKDFPAPPPLPSVLSNWTGVANNCSPVRTGWVEALQRSWFARGEPKPEWPTAIDPVWWDSDCYEWP